MSAKLRIVRDDRPVRHLGVIEPRPAERDWVGAVPPPDADRITSTRARELMWGDRLRAARVPVRRRRLRLGLVVLGGCGLVGLLFHVLLA